MELMTAFRQQSFPQEEIYKEIRKSCRLCEKSVSKKLFPKIDLQSSILSLEDEFPRYSGAWEKEEWELIKRGFNGKFLYKKSPNWGIVQRANESYLRTQRDRRI
jgi:hypothetical protein